MDFTKINNLTAVKKRGTGASETDVTTLTTVFDLDTLVEEVADTLYLGRRIPDSLSKIGCKGLTEPQGSGRLESLDIHPRNTTEAGDLTVVVRTKEPNEWFVESIAGAWRRMIMNLVGNAFKFTQSGFVEISLSKVKRTASSTPIAHLSVTDTGCGISAGFLKSKLFVPFSQEDPLCEGVGLGLPIVRQLVNSLGGSIDVESILGVGTRVDVHIPIKEADPASYYKSQPWISRPAASRKRQPSMGSTRVSLVGFKDYYPEGDDGILPLEARRKLSIQGSLTSALSTLQGWQVSLVESLDKAECGGDVAVIEENDMKEEMEISGLSVHDILLRSGFKFFVLLAAGNDRSPFFTSVPANTVCVSLPYVVSCQFPQKMTTTNNLCSFMQAWAAQIPECSAIDFVDWRRYAPHAAGHRWPSQWTIVSFTFSNMRGP